VHKAIGIRGDALSDHGLTIMAKEGSVRSGEVRVDKNVGGERQLGLEKMRLFPVIRDFLASFLQGDLDEEVKRNEGPPKLGEGWSGGTEQRWRVRVAASRGCDGGSAREKEGVRWREGGSCSSKVSRSSALERGSIHSFLSFNSTNKWALSHVSKSTIFLPCLPFKWVCPVSYGVNSR
jgi:hypothetical protein